MASKKQITVGGVAIGGGAPIRVQTMCTTKTWDTEATIAQILACEAEGAELIRVSVPNEKSARALPAIRAGIHIPLIADIHFDYRMAILSAELGSDCIRINPGNIGSKKRVDEVIAALKANDTPVRIGVNSGSLEKDLIDKHGGVTVAALVESAVRNIGYFEDAGMDRIKVSIKSSDVPIMIRCYEQLSQKTDWPLHLGVTEAGPFQTGAIKSAIGIGALLAQGIGDTVRVSLSCDPQREIPVALDILKALGLAPGVNIISCPSCARADINVEELAEGVLARVKHLKENVKIAVMGCVVNGPGEASDADFGVIGGAGVGLITRHGENLRKVKSEDLLDALTEELAKAGLAAVK